MTILNPTRPTCNLIENSKKSFAYGLSLMDVGLVEPHDQSLMFMHVCWLNFVSLFLSKSHNLNSGASLDPITDKSL